MQKEFENVDALQEIIQERGAKRIFLVTGGASYASIEPLIAAAIKDVEIERFSDFAVNPTLPDIEKGIARYRGFDPDLVVAIGGGSVIDVAKSVNILVAQKVAPREYIEGRAAIEERGKPLVAIPTTAGSGSEATQFAVVYIDAKKYSLDHEYVLPDYSIADPRCTYSLPPSVTAASGLDALCQGIESYWSVRSTEESKDHAREAIGLAIAHLRGAVKAEHDARDGMMRAAHLAGKAINISRTTASHALSYPLTAHFGIPHGHAVALTIGQLFVFNSAATAEDVQDSRGAEYVHATLGEIEHLLGVRDAIEAGQMIESLMRDIGLATRLSGLGVVEQDFPTILSEVSEQRAANNPRRFGAEAVTRVLGASL
jgi:alcohol dehydrogenase class IV